MITFAAEKRHKLMLGFGVLSGILGVTILAGGICAGAAGNIIAGTSFGPLVFAAGVITVKNTRGGKARQGQSAKEKALAVPGLICGGFLGLLTIPAVLFTVMFLEMSTGADPHETRKLPRRPRQKINSPNGTLAVTYGQR